MISKQTIEVSLFRILSKHILEVRTWIRFQFLRAHQDLQSEQRNCFKVLSLVQLLRSVKIQIMLNAADEEKDVLKEITGGIHWINYAAKVWRILFHTYTCLN